MTPPPNCCGENKLPPLTVLTGAPITGPLIFNMSAPWRSCRSTPPVGSNPLPLCRHGLGYGFHTLFILAAFVALVIKGERADDLLDSFAVDDDYTGAN